MANEQNLKPFKKGDPRINRNGRPKSFDKLRKLALQLAHEPAQGNGKDIVVDGQKQTQITMLLRQLMRDNPVKFLEYAFGKPKEELEISGEISATNKPDLSKLDPEQLKAVRDILYPDD